MVTLELLMALVGGSMPSSQNKLQPFCWACWYSFARESGSNFCFFSGLLSGAGRFRSLRGEGGLRSLSRSGGAAGGTCGGCACGAVGGG